MNNSLSNKLIKVLLDLVIFIEFSNEDIVNEDAAVGILEEVAAELQDLEQEDKQELLKQIKNLSSMYSSEKKAFLENFSDYFGL
ncbi:MAG: hypothetical protein AB8B66_06405 [Rickettsiaceae bacterium]